MKLVIPAQWGLAKQRIKPMFKFTEGACVALKNDSPQLGLTTGERGVVWALYDTQPPSYEVTFRAQDGSEFDALMHEEELVEPLVEPAVEQEISATYPERSLAAA